MRNNNKIQIERKLEQINKILNREGDKKYYLHKESFQFYICTIFKDYEELCRGNNLKAILMFLNGFIEGYNKRGEINVI